METIKKLCKSVADYNHDYDSQMTSIDKKIEIREKQIERLNAKRKKLSNSYTYWTENFVRPLAIELNKHLPEYKYEILGPFGIRSSCSIHFFKKDRSEVDYDTYFSRENMCSITIVPGSISNGEFYYQTGERKNEFAKGTIGEINGCNNVTKQIENIEELLDYLNRKIQLI